MTQSACLTDDELQELTHRCKHTSQARALNAMGFTFKRRPDGSVALDRQHYNQLMGVRGGATVLKEWEPDLNESASTQSRKSRAA